MVICEEMQKLRDWLNSENIEWYDNSDDLTLFWMVRTKFVVNGSTFSVINGVGSYGGCISYDSHNNGLLECMIDGNEPYGYLNADEVVAYINKARFAK